MTEQDKRDALRTLGVLPAKPGLVDPQFASRLAEAAIDYTHGRITLGELLRIAREMPR